MAEIIEVSADTFNETIQSDIPVLVDFWAPWCGPCRALSPVVDELGEELADRMKVAKCNVDDCQELALTYGVMSIPTLVLFKGGEEIFRSVGALPKPKLKADIEAHL